MLLLLTRRDGRLHIGEGGVAGAGHVFLTYMVVGE